ncbi:MAG TPA: ATP-binding protein [Polyangiaceae bacterium]|nr:ATP-binding protein [Polyangiaceae bacterium]
MSREVLDGLWEGYQLIAPDWTYVYVNEAAANQLGKKKEELIGRSIKDCFPGIERPETGSALQQCMSERRAEQVETALSHPNGSRRWLALRFLPVAEGVCILSLDITRAKRGAFTTHFGEDGVGAARESTGMANDGRPLVLVIDDDAESNRLVTGQLAKQYRVEAAFDGREGLRMAAELKPNLIVTEVMMPAMTGEELVVSLRRNPELTAIPVVVLSSLENDELRVRLLSSGAQDYIAKPFALAELKARVANLIQMKQAEALARRVAEDRALLDEFGSILASSLDYDDTCANIAELVMGALADLCILDVPDETGDGARLQVAHRSPAQAAWAGALRHLTFNRKQAGSFFIDLGTEAQLLVSEGLASRIGALTSNHDLQRALRELAPQEILAVPFNARHHSVGTMILIRTSLREPFRARDIELAEAMARRAALALDNAYLYRQGQRAIRARDDVLGMVAHDLRNPLHAMLLQLGLLRRAGQQPERRCLVPIEAVLREGARLDRLIQDLLEVARIEAGAFGLKCEPLRVSALVVDVAESNRLFAAESSVQLVVDAESDGSVELLGDRDRLLQAFDNLLGNAIKFTPPGGTVVVRMRARAAEVELSVTDTGPGIPEAELPHLFERYWQGQNADGRGAGIGLSIVKEIVEAHGGRIAVQTALGEGSAFVVVLPRRDIVALVASPKAGERRSG